MEKHLAGEESVALTGADSTEAGHVKHNNTTGKTTGTCLLDACVYKERLFGASGLAKLPPGYNVLPKPRTSYREKTSRCDHGPSIWQERSLSAGTISAWTGHQLHTSEPGLRCHCRSARVAEGWAALRTTIPCDHPSLDSHGSASPLPCQYVSTDYTEQKGGLSPASSASHAHKCKELSSNILI